MAHQLESMAYANEVPWHGLGERVADSLTVEDMIKAAKIDWTVSSRPLIFKGSEGEDYAVEDQRAIVRDSDDKLLTIAGKNWKPTQNHESMGFFKDFVEAGDAKMETAGSLREGRMIWGLAKMDESFELPGNDKTEGYLLVASPHEYGKPLQIKFTPVRVVCNNTITLALRSSQGTFKMNHTKKFGAFQMRKAKEALGIAHEMMDEYKENAEELVKMTMSKADVIEFLAPLFQPQSDSKDLMRDFADLANPKFLRVMDVYEKAPGASVGNAWGVLNAVTYYTDHATKARTNDNRLNNAWFGTNANLKQKTLDNLMLRVG